MRRLLQDAGKPDVPGLYIARVMRVLLGRRCRISARDPRRVEDVDTRGADHAADCANDMPASAPAIR